MWPQFERNYMCKKCEYLVAKTVYYHPHIPQTTVVNKKQKNNIEENPSIIRTLYPKLFTHLSTSKKQKTYLLRHRFTQFPQQLLPSLLFIK